MPRPKTKEELLNLSKSNFDKLNATIDAIEIDRHNEEFPDDSLYRNIRDVITHLHEWNTMVLSWYETGEKGGKPAIPGEGYSWKTLPELNVKIWTKYQSTNLDEARKLFQESFSSVYSLIESRTNEKLFEKKRYSWTGSTSLGAYLISCASSHCDWAIKKIRKAFK